MIIKTHTYDSIASCANTVWPTDSIKIVYCMLDFLDLVVLRNA